jgi:hypothetical protein
LLKAGVHLKTHLAARQHKLNTFFGAIFFSLVFASGLSHCGGRTNWRSLTGATTDNLPPGVLYQVKAAYKYQAEDMDELQFEVGEVIDVIEYDDPEEQVHLIYCI